MLRCGEQPVHHKLHGRRNLIPDSAQARSAPSSMGIVASLRLACFGKAEPQGQRATLGSHVRRPASGSRRLGRLEKCICISCEAHVRETDGFTVELGVYRLADVDLGGLNGDKAYEPCPLLKTPLAESLIIKTLDEVSIPS